MPGRFTLIASAEGLIKQFQLTKSFVMVPRFNIAPSQKIPVIKIPGEIEFLQWGFIPHWMDPLDARGGFINARAETVQTKPAFKEACQKRRCLVIMDGYYEWKAIGRIKQPYYIRQKTGEIFAVAGIWENDTCALLTTAANSLLLPLHHRMPLILPPEFYTAWLNPKSPKTEIEKTLLFSVYSGSFEFFPVSTKVNSSNFEGSDCIRSLH